MAVIEIQNRLLEVSFYNKLLGSWRSEEVVMDIVSQYPLTSSGASGGGGRISGRASVLGINDVPMCDQAVGQLAVTDADAELEELCSSLPGWHQQQATQMSGLLGGLARTVSAPSVFLLSASRNSISPGFVVGNGINCLSTVPMRQHYANDMRGAEEENCAQAHLALRNLQKGHSQSLHSEPSNVQMPAGVASGSSSFLVQGFSPAGGSRAWSGTAGGSYNTFVPPGEQHTSAMLLSLYPGLMGTRDGSGGGAGMINAAPNGSRLHVRGATEMPAQAIPSEQGAHGAGHWPSAGQRALRPPSGTAPSGLFSAHPAPSSGDQLGPVAALSGLGSGNLTGLAAAQLHASPNLRHALMNVGVPSRGLRQSSPDRGPERMSAAAPEVGAEQHGHSPGTAADMVAAESADPGDAAEPLDQDMDQEGDQDGDQDGGGTSGHSGQSASSGSSMCAALKGAPAGTAGANGSGGSRGNAGVVSSGAHVAVKLQQDGGIGAAPPGPVLGPHLAAATVCADGTGGNSAFRGPTGNGTGASGPRECRDDMRGPAGSKGATGGGVSRSNSGGAPFVHPAAGAPSDDGLQLLAMRFRNRPGRVPKAVAKLGPIAELAKGAATGKIKLEKDELADLVMTVETSLAKAATEQKEDSRARNRVAQQRFRNRQRETIAALQAKVEEQEALIAALQEKIHLYEQQQPQFDGAGAAGGYLEGAAGGGSKTGRSVRRAGSE